MPSNDLTGDVIKPDVGRPILLELTGLNADFIRLAGSLAATHQLVPVAKLDGLSKAALRRLTGCSFALFDLRLRNEALYTALRDGKEPAELGRSNYPEDQARRIKLFTLSALMYLRHVAEVNRFVAGLCFDARPKTLESVLGMPLNRLRQVADRCPGLLRSRFADSPEAWDGLLRLAKRNDTEPLLPAKILGSRPLQRT